MTGNTRKLVAINEYCERINATIERFGKNYDAFCNDLDYYDSVFMKVVQLSEISKCIDDVFKERTKDRVPWDKISGAFNHIRDGFMAAHHFSVLSIMDDELLWNTAVIEIPELEKFCKEELQKVNS
jgi:uncharacterized protein with HEPN domain